MPGLYEEIILWLGLLWALAIVVVCLRSRCFAQYYILCIYLLSNVAFTLGCYYVLHVYGYSSDEYLYSYYTGDAVPNIVGYLLIGSFFDRLLRESAFHKYVRSTLAIFFLLIA